MQQSIWIEGDIHVKVLSVERDRVKLGITAPGDVKVMREELFGDEGAPADSVPAREPETRENHRAAS